MITTPLLFPQCQLIELKFHQDHRGYFSEIFQSADYQQQFNFQLSQMNQSYSQYGVIRGLHAQAPPHAQAKIIQVITGKILDIIVDICPKSSHFGKSMGVILNNQQQLYIPQGFLHGYSVLSENAIIQYYTNHPYHPESEIGIRYDDNTLNINWMIPANKQIISQKDLALPYLTDLNLK